MQPADPPEYPKPSTNKGGRPRGSTPIQFRRDAVFLAFQVLGELRVANKHQAPFARLANLIVDEASTAEFNLEGTRVVAGMSPPPRLTKEALKNQASYTAQRVNNTKKDAKNWDPADLAFLQESADLIVLMFLAPVAWAVDTLAQQLVMLNWPHLVIQRLSNLAKLSGGRRPGYTRPGREDMAALTLFVAHLNERGG